MTQITAEIKIETIEFPNKGIGKYEGHRITIKDTMPGQLVEAIVSKKRGVYQGRKLRVIEKAPNEIEPACCDFAFCGGCCYQNISYQDELNLKEKMVLDTLQLAGISEFEYLGIDPAPSDVAYRNKMEFSFGDLEKGGELSLGLRKRLSNYEVVTVGHCQIVDSDFKRILLATLDFFKDSEDSFYHRFSHEGSLRHLIVRKAKFTGEILVNLVTTSKLKTPLQSFVSKLTSLSLDGKLAGILHTTNDSVSDAVKVEKLEVLSGHDYFHETLLGLRFKISAFSFFQTNSAGAENLYSTVREFAGDTQDKKILDLYCGTGTITQILAEKASEVIGVELVEEAIVAANENAKLNGINNCTFYAGDVLKIVPELSIEPDLIILDPPRDGIHPKAINKIIAFNAREIIYVSCKVSSLARDLAVFKNSGYEVKKIRVHDLFARTYHVETVVLLSKLLR